MRFSKLNEIVEFAKNVVKSHDKVSLEKKIS